MINVFTLSFKTTPKFVLMLRQTVGQKMVQSQKLSPQQIQLMKLLQVPTAVLEQRIKEELEANPALDEGNDQEETSEFELNNEDTFDEKEKNQDEQYELD